MARKGYNSKASIPEDLLDRLNHGLDETKTLAEWLAVDQEQLLQQLLIELNIPAEDILIKELTDSEKKVMVKLQDVGAYLFRLITTEGQYIYTFLSNHRSDIVREWAALSHMVDESLALAERFKLAQPFSKDPNMNVREIAWYSLRPSIKKIFLFQFLFFRNGLQMITKECAAVPLKQYDRTVSGVSI
jgi:hypothetical protein